jgi:lysophospholipase L1-like esterase
VNGAAVPDYLKCPLADDLRLLRPDLVIFGIGINDAHEKDFDTVAFKNNYLALCDSIRKVNPKCAFIFVTNNDSYRKVRRRYTVNTNGPLAREVFYRLAALTGGAVWDQFEIMGGLKSMEKWQKAGLAQKDKVHFTRAGYRLVGDMLYEALYNEIARQPQLPLSSAPKSSKR